MTEDKVATELLALEENKADKDGKIALAEYANQLVSTVGESDDIPYVFRKTGGSLEVGRRVALKDIVGGSIIWNQIIKNGNFASNTGWSNTTGVTRSIANNKCTLTAKSNIGADYISATSTAGARNWDVYFVSAYVTASRATHIQLAVKAKKGSKIAVPANKRTYCGAIIKATNAGLAYAIYINASSELQQGDTVVIENAKSINLTEAFGGWTIANYVLALETATPGAGLAWVQKLFPNEYYTYDPGTVRSVNVSAHKTVGFNAFDLAAGTAKLIGGIEYQITGAYSALSYSSGETITPDENGKFTPTVNGVMTVTGGSGTTCVHLVWDGERDGQYEAYSAHTYALDDSVTLRGFPTVDSNNNFVYDGDTYAPDGTVTRKYAEMTGVTGAIGDTVTLTGIDTNATNILTSAGRLENVGTLSGDTLTLTAALTDATIVYPLATPTTEAADPYTETQICDNWGTEEFEDAGVAAGTRDVVIPVGHDSVYGSNLRDKLEAAPDSPDADGDYIMHRENGQNSYFRFNVLEYI